MPIAWKLLSEIALIVNNKLVNWMYITLSVTCLNKLNINF